MGGSGEYPNYGNYTAANNYSETLRLVWDESETSYDDLLTAYWQYAPDPSAPEPDPAYQLRIFYVDSTQKAAAQASIAKNKGALIELVPAADYTFWKAEEYHQHYFDKSGQTCGSAVTPRH